MLRRFDSINMLREKNICVLFPSWLEKEQKTKPYPQTNVFNASHSIIDGNSVKRSQHSRPRSGTSSIRLEVEFRPGVSHSVISAVEASVHSVFSIGDP